ncbi:ATP-binding protein [Glycomyces sp. NPDC049804]|uniref:ATP-binding protein n=1 Tax=Glycomyces sp. NPDC049804 TaxID=3154363 RepID=UPI0034300A44
MPEPIGSTRFEAQRLVAYFVGGFRLATLIQMVPSAPLALSRTEHPLLAAVSWTAALGMLIGVAAVAIARRKAPGPRIAVLDVAVSVGLLVAGLWTVPPALRFGTWEGFQMAYTLCIACSLAGVRSPKMYTALFVALAAAESVYLAPTVQNTAGVPTAVGNLLTLLALGPFTWICAGVILRLGDKADEARDYAARIAREEEERRAKLAVHNGTALLRLLSDESADETTRKRLRVQAEAEANRMRAYLRGAPRADDERTDLAALVASIGEEHSDMPLTVVADLAIGVRLEPGLAADLAAALRSLLLNVRQHAKAEQVVVHAEESADGAGWAVTVHDDGIGFEPAPETYGVGLRQVVIDQLSTFGVTTEVTSMPGLGTMVTMVARYSKTHGEES